jgi:hypothetical protein
VGGVIFSGGDEFDSHVSGGVVFAAVFCGGDLSVGGCGWWRGGETL